MNFKQAYFNNDAVAVKIGKVFEKVFDEWVEEGFINDKSSTWFNLCQVAWAEYQEKNQPE